MTIRELPLSEWSRLAGTDMERICALLKAKDATARILVAEDDRRLIGHFGLFPVWHAEACWIDPAYRGRLLGPLVNAMRDLAAEVGVKAVMTASIDDTVTDYLVRLGAEPLAGSAFLWKMTKEPICLPQ